MALLDVEWFSFQSRALPEDFFGVVRFKGTEGLSRCYEFDITLVSDKGPADLDRVLSLPVVFTIHRPDGDVAFNGILSGFRQLHSYRDQDFIFYRANLVPRLWWLTLTRHNQVFLDKTVPEIIGLALKDGGLGEDDFEFRLMGKYPPREFVCQYNESHFDFVSRWMEREGIYYFFEPGENNEKLIVTDTRQAHQAMPQGRRFIYGPLSGLDALHREEVVSRFSCCQRLAPQALRLKDYNYRRPSVDLESRAEVSAKGLGEIYIYGEHYRTPVEGRDLAQIRAEEQLCRQRTYQGQSSIPFVRPGYDFDLIDHYRDDFNQTYLTVTVNHQGNQAAFLLSGIRAGLTDLEKEPKYENRFQAIESRFQFRPARSTPRPHIHGTVNAFVDAAGSGQYAELDNSGRYRVRLPFDLAGSAGGKASCPVRMIQPYGGPNYGLHFPLRKGCEVLLTFVEGNPDRPVIASAVPNPEQASPVTSANQTQNVLKTSAGNRLVMEDRQDHQRILVASPRANTFLRLGSHNDPGGESEDDGFVWSTDKDGWLACHGFEIKVLGNSSELIVGGTETMIFGGYFYSVIGAETDVILGGSYSFKMPKKKLSLSVENGNLLEQRTRVIKRRLKATVSQVNATDSKIQAVDRDIEALDEQTRLANEKVEAVDQAMDGEGQVVDALNEKIEAANEKTEALGNRVTTAQEKVTACNTALRQAGSVINVINVKITAANTLLEDSEMIIQEAGSWTIITPVNMDN